MAGVRQPSSTKKKQQPWHSLGAGGFFLSSHVLLVFMSKTRHAEQRKSAARLVVRIYGVQQREIVAVCSTGDNIDRDDDYSPTIDAASCTYCELSSSAHQAPSWNCTTPTSCISYQDFCVVLA